MRLLVITQKVDTNDGVLGFFHGWLRELSKINESVSVVCLQAGDFDLPQNVSVHSLGKEKGVSKMRYVFDFYKYLFLFRDSYDAVFVHMNEEYVLLAGLYWKLRGIPVYFWRNHPTGSLLTRIAVLLSTKVFCTSSQSFTARFKKAVIMPVGVDTGIFHMQDGVTRKKYSVCMVGRVSPVKHIELALVAVKYLIASGGQVSLSVIGSAPQRDSGYYDMLKKYVTDNGLSTYVTFMSAVSQLELPKIYASYELYLNLTPTGSFDKTIVEASACGSLPLVSNTSLRELLPEICVTEPEPDAIAQSIQRLFESHIRVELQPKLSAFVESQSLSALMARLKTEMHGSI